MLRSLYTGVAGMRSHQVRMDVIGNNIANVNTTGFKSGRVHFTDMLYQTMRDAVAPGKSYSGLDPIQVGLGVKVGSVGTLFKQSGFEATERMSDFAINGNGFFVLATTTPTTDPNNPQKEFFYTRDGNFTIDQDGYLMHTGTGIKVQGWGVDSTSGNLTVIRDVAGTPTTKYVDEEGKVWNNPNFTGEYPDAANQEITSLDDLKDVQMLTKWIDLNSDGTQDAGETLDLITFSVSKDGIITGLFENPSGPEPIEAKIGKIAVTAFTNTEGLYKNGENLFQPSMNSGKPMLNFGSPSDATIEAGYLELSNVDLTNEFANMIITQRGFQANSRVITTSDQMLEELLMLKR